MGCVQQGVGVGALGGQRYYRKFGASTPQPLPKHAPCCPSQPHAVWTRPARGACCRRCRLSGGPRHLPAVGRQHHRGRPSDWSRRHRPGCVGRQGRLWLWVEVLAPDHAGHAMPVHWYSRHSDCPFVAGLAGGHQHIPTHQLPTQPSFALRPCSHTFPSAVIHKPRHRLPPLLLC